MPVVTLNITLMPDTNKVIYIKQLTVVTQFAIVDSLTRTPRTMNPIFYEILKAHAPVLFEDKADMVVDCDWQLDERDSATGTIQTMWCVTHDTDHKSEDVDPLDEDYGEQSFGDRIDEAEDGR